MTRLQQNEIIIAKLGESLKDTPDVRKRLSYSFNQWFVQQLAAGAKSEAPPADAAPAAGGEG